MILRVFQNVSRQSIGSTILHEFSQSRFHSIKVAVVGSGPAGFYTTQKLLKNPDVEVDIYEKLPIPFGLIRYGVAPDHPEVKNVINSFTNTMISHGNRVNFYGNIILGKAIKLDDLIDAYHAVVLCYGSSQDKLLGIEGELETNNTISARNFVGWYNGVPEDKDLKINLDCETACIVGQGNVSLDVARILLKRESLAKTDITSYAQQAIAKSRIKKIYIIGRRGPNQTSFTTKELRELIALKDGKVKLEPDNIFDRMGMTLEALRSLPRQRRRLTELLLNLSKTQNPAGIECIFKFLSKPHKIIADPKTGFVTRLDLQKTAYNDLAGFMDENQKPEDLDEYEHIDCGLVIRSIGYKALPISENIPMDHKLGAIANTNGKVQGYSTLYCSGWLATGASGVIASTLNSSQITSKSILDDIQKRNLPNLGRSKQGFKDIKPMLAICKVQVVHFNNWLRIDELERRIGESLGKSREKLVDVEEILKLVE